ncbi:hypothetical protein ACPB9E_07295 [Streptomyces exfoliatus]|uniref:hypothetical protein n=1 Tax=Streptomyces exfoliatus TaxID=1905 RepID=UPI003C2F6B8D
MALADGLGGTERPGRVRPSPAGRPAREAESLGAGASLGSALDAEGAGAPVPVGAGAGGGGVPATPVWPGEAEPEGVPGRVAEGVPERVEVADGVPEEGDAEGDEGDEGDEGGVGDEGDEGGDEEGALGVVPAGGGGAVVPTDVAGASAPYARLSPYPGGAAYRAHVQANTQVSAGPRARARALRNAGVTG